MTRRQQRQRTHENAQRRGQHRDSSLEKPRLICVPDEDFNDRDRASRRPQSWS